MLFGTNSVLFNCAWTKQNENEDNPNYDILNLQTDQNSRGRFEMRINVSKSVARG